MLVGRLILNLKVAAGRGRIINMDGTTYLDDQSQLETIVLGNMANKIEGLDTPERQPVLIASKTDEVRVALTVLCLQQLTYPSQIDLN